MNPALEPAVKFLQWLVAKQMIPEAEKQKVAAALHKIKAALAAQAVDDQATAQAAPPAPEAGKET
jgi:ferritin